MQGLRSIAAVVAGFGFMASTVMVGSIIATALFIPAGVTATPGGAAAATIPVLYVAANLLVSLLGAVMGGWLAARIGAFAPLSHALALAILTAVLAAFSAFQVRDGAQPAWYPSVVGIIGVAGVLLGGKLRAAAAAADAGVIA
jgi:hypothetical protein